MRGGYQIIDFQKIALTDSNTKVDGVYKAIQDNPLKVLQLNNINLNGTLKDDVFTTATKGTNKYTFDVYDGILTVTSADNVRWVSHDTIQTVISNIDDLQQETSDIKDMISDAYNAETAYTAGQYCIYNDTLYKCIADTTAGTLPTDTGYFSEVSVADEISTLNSDYTLLWENPNITNEFAEQDVNVDMSHYKAVMIEFLEYIGDYPYRATIEARTAIVGTDYNYTVVCPYADTVLYSFSCRKFNVANNSKAHFYAAVSDESTLNTLCVPYRIWGIKHI